MAMKAKGAQSIKNTKVKGHATVEDIIKGKNNQRDKENNGIADETAEMGLGNHGDGVLYVA